MLMTGLGSGMDYEAMISAIIAAERAPKDNQLNRQEGMNNAEMDALKEVQSVINSFRDKVENLNSSRELQKLKASLSNEDVLSATVDDVAVAGEYSFEVTQLAQAQRDQLFKASSDATFTSGTVSFDTGGKTVNVDIPTLKSDLITKQNDKKQANTDQVYKNIAEKHNIDMNVAGWETDAHKALTDNTDPRFEQTRLDSYNSQQKIYDDEIARLNSDGVNLEEIQSAINNHADNDGVKATLVRSGNDISMVLNGKETGAANSYTINSTLSGANVNKGAVNEGQVNLQAGQDASVKFGTMTLTSATNKMENVIDGISLNLKDTGKVNVNVERDEASVNSNIKAFVDAYNSVIETVNTYTKSSEEEAAALSGDSATRSMVSRLRGVVGGEYTSSTYQTLSQLGVTTTRQGTLEIDQKKLDKALEDDFDAVSKLFLGDGASPGMMDNMMEVLDDYHKNGGTFDRRIDQLEYNNKRVAEERERLDARMNAKTLTLRDYYAKMDTKIANMNQTQSMLIGMLG